MSERQKPHITQQQVERACEKREAHHLHEKDRIDEARRDCEKGNHDDEGHLQMSCGTGACGLGGCRRLGGARDLVHRWVPNKPAGLNMSTIAMITKITTFDASG